MSLSSRPELLSASKMSPCPGGYHLALSSSAVRGMGSIESLLNRGCRDWLKVRMLMLWFSGRDSRFSSVRCVMPSIAQLTVFSDNSVSVLLGVERVHQQKGNLATVRSVQVLQGSSAHAFPPTSTYSPRSVEPSNRGKSSHLELQSHSWVRHNPWSYRDHRSSRRQPACPRSWGRRHRPFCRQRRVRTRGS